MEKVIRCTGLFSPMTELDPRSEHFFELDIYKMSNVPEREKAKWLKYLLNKFPLNEAQRAAFLNLRVLLAAGSNKGVDNFAIAVAKAIQSDSFLRSWCGRLVRFKTRSCQMAVLRAKSASTRFPGRAISEVRGPQAVLEHHMHHLVKQHAESNCLEDKDCREYTSCGETASEVSTLRPTKCSARATTDSRRATTTTLSNPAQEALHHPGAFDLDFLVCDEVGQCLEGDCMIVMTMPSIKAVILIGDQEQLLPTVVTEHSNNEGAKYLKRSLMERLYSAVNYRNRPDILDLFNRNAYAGRLTAAPQNSSADRVGNALDAFTRSRHHFYNFDLEGVRGLFIISVIGKAKHEGNSRSWSNIVRISKPQQRTSPARGCHDYQSLYKVIDASQGQEAKLVVFLMTKPSDNNGQRPGFLVDCQRMNVALSHVQQVEVIIGNLEIWNPASIKRLAKWTKNTFLVKLLTDVTAKGHTLMWASIRRSLWAVIGFPGYISHDNRQPKDKPHPRQEDDETVYHTASTSTSSPQRPQSLTPRAESRLRPERA
ncbi:hypothetical protein V8E54_004312 [Elaphomyces granulatus]